jgi:hypothetical protein
MLREIRTGEASRDVRRRWFVDDYFELLVWLDDKQDLEGFQLCYDRGRHERAVTWTRTGGLKHVTVDQGESSPLKNQTPLLYCGGNLDKGTVLERFHAASRLIPRAIAEFVEQKIDDAS